MSIQIDGEQINHILLEIKKLNKVEQKAIYYYLCEKLHTNPSNTVAGENE